MPPSSSKEKRLAKKAEKAAATGKKVGKVGKKEPELDVHGNPVQDTDGPATTDDKLDEVKRLADQMDQHGISDRVTTGVLSSTQQSKDVKITSCSLVFHGRVLITDSTLELSFGRRYGLLGENGCGKSTLLKAIAAREYPIPDHVDIYLLNEGAPPSDLGALEWVVKEAENEMERLDKLAEKLLEDEGPESPVLIDLYDVCFSLNSFPNYHNSTTRMLTMPCSTWTRWTPQPLPPALPSF
jgi:ATP-binding cassette subfamily F protein 2